MADSSSLTWFWFDFWEQTEKGCVGWRLYMNPLILPKFLLPFPSCMKSDDPFCLPRIRITHGISLTDLVRKVGIVKRLGLGTGDWGLGIGDWGLGFWTMELGLGNGEWENGKWEIENTPITSPRR